jgi:dihydrofolate reductase
MKKLILSTNVTLDGFMAGPNKELDWHFDNWNEEMAEYAWQQLNNVDTILVGRGAYEGMSTFWPEAAVNPIIRKRDVEFAKRMNDLPKIVFSKTLSSVDWNNSRLASNSDVEEVAALKKMRGKDIILWGGIGMAQSFIEHDLIDEYRIWVAPIAIGNGIPLFTVHHKLNLKLLSSKMFSNGVILLVYAPYK